MNKIILGVVAGIAVGAVVTWIVVNRPDAGGHKQEEEHAEESRVVHTNGQIFVKLDVEAMKHAGLTLAPLEAAGLKPEFKGFGRVLDPAPLATQVTLVATAQAALQSSTREFQRLKVLHGQDQNVSTRALEAAEAAVVRDHIAAEAAQLALLTTWGQSIAGQPDLPAFVRSLASFETALARIDVPLGTVLKSPPVGGRIAALTGGDRMENARFLGSAVTADPQTQSRGFLFLLSEHPLAPGTALTGWLAIPGEERKGVLIPRDAVVRHEGDAFVYSRAGDGLFQRQKVALDNPIERGWFVTGELKPQDEIVIAGAEQLLSEELKGQGRGE